METQLTDLRETRGLMERVLFKVLEETHIKGVVPDESPAKRKRRMSCPVDNFSVEQKKTKILMERKKKKDL